MDIFFDASAIVAMVTGEPERDAMVACAIDAERRFTSALALFEAEAAVVRKLGGDHREAASRLAELQRTFEIVVVAIDAEVGRWARVARRRYGRGSGHPSKLNMGDCFAYACARHNGLALLFKGEDFVHTDIQPAIPSRT